MLNFAFKSQKETLQAVLLHAQLNTLMKKVLGAHISNMNTNPNSNPTGCHLFKATTKLFKAICKTGHVGVAGGKALLTSLRYKRMASRTGLW